MSRKQSFSSVLQTNSHDGAAFYENVEDYLAAFPEASCWKAYLTHSRKVMLIKSEHIGNSCLSGDYFPIFLYSDNILITNGDDTMIRLYTSDIEVIIKSLQLLAPCDMHEIVDILGFSWD